LDKMDNNKTQHTTISVLIAGTAQSERSVDSLSRLFRENRQKEVVELAMGKEWILF